MKTPSCQTSHKSIVNSKEKKLCFVTLRSVGLRYDLTDTAGVLENKVLGMLHGLDDYSVLIEGF